MEELEFSWKHLRFQRRERNYRNCSKAFLELFNGDYSKIETFRQKLSKRFGFEKVFRVSGQTYDRKIDAKVLALLSNIAQSTHKFQRFKTFTEFKEIEEPFEKNQIGSSAMAYKRNPMRSENFCISKICDVIAKFICNGSCYTMVRKNFR